MRKTIFILSLFSLSLLSYADYEVYDGQTVSQDFSGQSMNYSSWKGANLSGSKFDGTELKGADFSSVSGRINFSNAILTDADLFTADLTNADFADAIIEGAIFSNTTPKGFTKEQLYSTASYKNKDLSGIEFSAFSKDRGDLSGWNFSNQNLTGACFANLNLTNANFQKADLTGVDFRSLTLTNANFQKADLTGADFRSLTLTNADFTDAIIEDVDFNHNGRKDIQILTKEQLYSTASYKNKNLSGIGLSGLDLSGWNFSSQNLTGADFGGWASLTNADFTDAIIEGAIFYCATSAGFTKEQLYSTASYKNKNLRGIDFRNCYVVNWDFSGQNLQNTSFSNASISRTVFIRADLRGYSITNNDGLPLIRNTIWSDGIVRNFVMELDTDSFTIRKYEPEKIGGALISAKLNTSSSISGEAVLTLEKGAEFEVINNSTLTLSKDSEIVINTDLNSSTKFVIEEGSSFEFLDGAKLVINLEDFDRSEFNSETLKFSVMNWEDVSKIIGLEDLVKGEDIVLNVNGKEYSYSWGYEITDGDLLVVLPGSSTYVDIKILSVPEATLEVFENTKHNLEVSASEKNGKKLTYTWYVDKQNGKGFVKAGTKPTLTITPKANMVGWQYYCAVSNGSETRNTSVSTIVAVKTPAKITGKPKALEAFEGVANSGFKVSATGSDLKYQWQVYKVVGYNAKGKPIYDWVDIAGATSANYNPESSLENNGLMYRCKVYNDGSAAYTSGVKYTVREAPKVEVIEVLQCKEKLKFDGSTVVAYEDYPIDLQATAKGYKIKYQWYKNGAAIKGATKSKYTIKKPLESQDSYYCEVYNGDVKDQSSTFVLEVRECPMPASFEGHSLYVSDITDMGDPCRDMRMIFLNKNTLRFAMEDYAVSNPVLSYKRVSPTKAAVTLKFKLYTNDEPVSKLNTISYSYSGEIEFKDNVFRLDLSDKKNGSFVGSFSDADMESADKTSLLTLPINQKIIVGDETLMLLDKKNFALGEIQGTYSYKSNKNGTGVLKLNYKDGSNKYTAEVSMFAFSGNSGVAVVSINWNEGKDKFISSDFEEFEIAE